MNNIPYTIIMADDDEDDRLLAQDAMSMAGSSVDCITVSDGQELLNYLRNEGKFTGSETRHLPSIILLDLNMPILDGRETLKLLKEDPALKAIPVVILSTSNNQEDIEQGYELGAASYMVKPTDFNTMVEMMKCFNQFWFNCSSVPIIENTDLIEA